MTTPNEFLSLLWGEDFEAEYPDHRIVLWTMPGKQTSLFSSPLAAGDASVVLGSNHDVYCGVCCVSKDHDPNTGRGTKTNMTLACGLWADIDFGPGHKKKVPPSLEAAMGLLVRSPMAPTVVVHSGHGIHSWWILKEPEALLDPPARARLERACKGWQQIMANAAREQGYEIDSTSDCTRVLRVAGTFNRKDPRDVLPVRILSSDGPRFDSINDFLSYLPTEDKKLMLEASAVSFVMDPKASPDSDLFDALKENNSKFRHTLEHKRRWIDTSCSGYEQALASQAVQCGWSDQEIANLIIFHRRKWEPSNIAKVMRPDYIARTINRARSGLVTSTPEKDIIMAAVAADVDMPNEGVDETRSKLDHLGLVFGGIDIDYIIGYGKEETSYFIQCRGELEKIYIGKDQHLRDNYHTRMAILKATKGKHVMKRMRDAAWCEVLRVFFNVLIIEDIPEDTVSGKFQSWLDLFLTERRIYRDEELEVGFRGRQPIYKNGELWINSSILNGFIEARFMEKIKRNELHLALTLSGFKPNNKALRIENNVILHQRYWTKEMNLDDTTTVEQQENCVTRDTPIVDSSTKGGDTGSTK